MAASDPIASPQLTIHLEFVYFSCSAGDRIVSIDATPQLDDNDYKKTQKMTWLAVANQAPFTPVTCIHYDHILSKPVLSKEDDFKDFLNRDSKVRQR